MSQAEAEMQETRTTTLSTLEATIAETLAARPDMMQMQMENESIRAECRVRPRDLGRIRRELLKTLDDFPGLAERCIYTKNCGRKQDPVTKKWATEFAEGLSIRAAELLAEAYQYNRVRVDVIFPIDAERMTAKVEAVFVDLQNGRLWQASGTLSRRYMGWDGDPKDPNAKKIEKLKPEDSFLSQTCKGEASKLIRECILRCISPVVKQDFYDACQAKRETLLDDEGTNKIIESFKRYNVTQAMIERLLGRTKKKGWTAEDRRLLLGIWTGIRDGDQTVDEAFGDQEQSGEPDDGKDPSDQAAASISADLAADPITAAADPLSVFRADVAHTDVIGNLARKLAAFVAEHPEQREAAEQIATQREVEIGGGK